MKKLFFPFTLSCLLAAPLAADPVFNEKDFYYQKPIFTYAKDVSSAGMFCQAVYIAPEWLLTAAHCVTDFIKQHSCHVRITMAQGEKAAAVAEIPCQQVYLPKPKKGDKYLPWDLALLHYTDNLQNYEFVSEDTPLDSLDDFINYAKQEDADLYYRWQNRIPKTFLPLLTFKETKPNVLLAPLVVARVEKEGTSYVGTEQHPLTFGKIAPAVWITDGFDVQNGNSGGAVAVYSPKDHSLRGILGIVSASQPNAVPSKWLEAARYLVPDFGNKEQFFIFYGFDENSSLKFIQRTIRSSRPPQEEPLKKVVSEDNPFEYTHQLKVKGLENPR